MAEPLWPSAAAPGAEEYNPLMDHGSSTGYDPSDYFNYPGSSSGPSGYRGPPPPNMDAYRPPPPPGPSSPGHRPPPPPMGYNQYPPNRNMSNGYPYQQSSRRPSMMPPAGGPAGYNNSPMPYGNRNGPWHQPPPPGHSGPPPPPSGPRFEGWPPINDLDSSGRGYEPSGPRKSGGPYGGGGSGSRPMFGSGGSGTNPNSGLWMGGGAPNPLF